MICLICGAEMGTAGCTEPWRHGARAVMGGINFGSPGAFNTGGGVIDTGQIHRAPLEAEIARLRTLADGLAEALRHMQWCRACGEEQWEGCDGGRDALAALAAYEAQREEPR